MLKNGLSDIRTGYLRSSFHSGRPFARAVATYGLCSSSSRLARVILISPAVPATPTTTIGIHRWEIRSSSLPRFQAASAYSGENSPPTLWPKYRNPMYIITSASMNSGTAIPMKPRKDAT